MTELTKEQLDAAIAAGISVQLIQRSTPRKTPQPEPPPPSKELDTSPPPTSIKPEEDSNSISTNTNELCTAKTYGLVKLEKDSNSFSTNPDKLCITETYGLIKPQVDSSSFSTSTDKLCMGKTYGLRPRRSDSKRIKYEPDCFLPSRVPKRSKSCFRDTIMSHVDMKTYHGHHKDEYAVKVIELACNVRDSQLTQFIHESSRFIAISWLTAIRIFEYKPSKQDYVEVKRIPKRYIEVSASLITSIHYCDSHFYIAYLWGDDQRVDSEDDKTKPYVETRDIYGKTIGSRRYYTNTVYNIYSDSRFIYLLTSDNTVNIQQKSLFQLASYSIDVASHCPKPVVKAWVHLSTYESTTNLQIIVATTDNILLINYTILEQRELMSYTFPDDLVNINLIKKGTKGGECQYILLRTGYASSSIEVLHVNSISLAVQTSLIFTSYHILQIKLHGGDLYIIGHKRNAKTLRLEVGRLSLKTLGTISACQLPECVDATSKLLIHDDNLVVIKNSQQFVTKANFCKINKDRFRECSKCTFMVNTEDFEAHSKRRHESLFSDMEIRNGERVLTSLKF